MKKTKEELEKRKHYEERIKHYCLTYCKKLGYQYISTMRLSKNGLFIYGKKNLLEEVYTYIPREEFENEKLNYNYINDLLDTFISDSERFRKDRKSWWL